MCDNISKQATKEMMMEHGWESIKCSELASLRVELERLKSQLSSTRADLHEGFKTVSKLQDENDALRAEMKRLQEEADKYHYLLCTEIETVKSLRSSLALAEKVVDTARRWKDRKGHGPDHDCDLCNSLHAYKEGKR